MALLSIDNLDLRYPGQRVHALKGVNLEIKEGEFVVFSGGSGCGKTSLIRCLNGIIPNLLPAETSGDIRLKGRSLKNFSPQTLSALVGSVFQDPRSQFFHIDVIDEIAFGPENMGYSKPEIRRRVDDALDVFKLDHLRGRRMFDLSSGEKQKVIFAAVYAMGPEVYILDEPSSNLDVAATKELRDVLHILKEAGRTIIIVEHRLHYLSGLYDRLLIMEQGRIALEAPVSRNLTLEERNRFGLRSLTPPNLSRQAAHLSSNSRQAEVGICIESLTYRYPQNKKTTLQNISARFQPGSVAAVVGPNGSGKTTLIKLLGGLLREISGKIRWNNQPLSAPKRLKQCGFVMQESGHQLFFPSVRQELASGFIHRPTEDEVDRFLKELNLTDKAQAHPQTLSGGQQQRLVIGAALSARPGVLILDEPTSGLDAGHMRRLARMLQEEARRGTAVLVVTHDLEFIQSCCDQLVYIQNGKVASLCTIREPSREILSFFDAPESII